MLIPQEAEEPTASSPRVAKLLSAGLWLHRCGDVKGARALFRAVTEIDTGNTVAKNMLAKTLAEPEVEAAPPPPAPVVAEPLVDEVPSTPRASTRSPSEPESPAPRQDRGEGDAPPLAETKHRVGAPWIGSPECVAPEPLSVEEQFFEPDIEPPARPSRRGWMALAALGVVVTASALSVVSAAPAAPEAPPPAVAAAEPAAAPMLEPGTIADVPAPEVVDAASQVFAEALVPAPLTPKPKPRKARAPPAKRSRHDKDEILDPYAP